MGEQKQWRSEIQHGPDGETDYAWVHDDKDALVCVARTHHANAIVRTVNTYPAVADLAEALANWLEYAEDNLSEFDLDECFSDEETNLCPKCRSNGCLNKKISNARTALNRFRALEAGKGGVG